MSIYNYNIKITKYNDISNIALGPLPGLPDYLLMKENSQFNNSIFKIPMTFCLILTIIDLDNY